MGTHLRILTIRLMPDAAQWQLLRRRASEAMAYRNRYARALWAKAQGLQVDPAHAGDVQDVEKHIRRYEHGDISAGIYVECEAEVKKDWARDGRKVLAGAPLPQYRQKDSLAFHGHKRQAESQIQIITTDQGYAVRLHVSARHVEGEHWLTIPVARRTQHDEYRVPLLEQMCTWQIPIKKATVIFKVAAGKTLLRLTYPVTRALPPVGERHATLSQLQDGRVLLRTETAVQDYTSRLVHLTRLKDQWDAITRRWRAQIGRRRGHARLARRKNASLHADDQRHTLLHQWSREMVTWLITQGVGTLTIVGLVGGDWAASQLQALLAYKCAEAGIQLVAPTLDDPTVERTAEAAVKKERRRVTKLKTAVREVHHQLAGSAL
jgi:hypothetical protein